jgi:branched-chain amino acid transport system substrate-binding protein
MTDTWRLAAAIVSATIAWSAIGAAGAQTPPSIKIGYAISKTGPNAGGAATTLLPNYEMWVEELNAAGGLKVGGKRVPIEVITYDDRSSSEEAVRAVERLINQDKVHFILAPFGTGLNLAVAPVLAREGYPHLGTSAITDRAPELARRWPNSFWLTGTSSLYAVGIVDLLTKLKADKKINNRVAMVAVADAFGIDLSTAARTAFKKAGFELVYDKSYPLGTQDMAPILTEVKGLKPDTFVAFSYPPDTMQITEQARISAFNAQVFYAGVGTAFPLFKQRFGKDAEGVLSFGGWPANEPRANAYLAKLKEKKGREPDGSAGGLMTYAALQMLQQAIERVGKIDRAAVIKDLQTGTFETIAGDIKLVNNLPPKLWQVGQWQDGRFTAVAPVDRPGAKPVLLPKPAWQVKQ